MIDPQIALDSVLQWDVLLVIAAAAVYGIVVGAIPGLTATMAVALLVPVTFFLDPIPAIAAIVTTVTCSIFAGDIPGALVRIPGTPASAAYTLDAYALTRAGRQEQALGISLVFSVIGGLIGVAVLMVAAPQLVKLRYTHYEYFWLCVLGLSCAAVVSRESRMKGLFGLSIGLLIATIGVSPQHGSARFVFHKAMYQGVNFLPAMIGLFGVSEVLRNVLHLRDDPRRLPKATEVNRRFILRHLWDPLTALVKGVLPLVWVKKVGLLRSSAIGSFVGMLPGAGADLAAWIAYAVSKRFSRTPDDYGQGSVEGLADATSANNSALASAWLPALVFGIPGDSVTAIALGVLMMHNITPGSQIFSDPRHSVTVASIFAVFIIANLLLIPLGLIAIRLGSLLVRIPRRVLMPIILLFCTLGAYSFSASMFDVLVMLALGVVGFFLECWGVPLGPVVLGIILGETLEHRFLQCWGTPDPWWRFFTQPLSALLAAACLAMWFGPLIVRMAGRLIRRHPSGVE